MKQGERINYRNRIESWVRDEREFFASQTLQSAIEHDARQSDCYETETLRSIEPETFDAIVSSLLISVELGKGES